jgi:DNA-binding MarR family transcriptional regulator
LSKERDKLIQEVGEAFRRHGQAQDAMDSAAAMFFGVHRTDMSLLDALQLNGRMTAGALARSVGLSPAATTAALDRLEKVGYVRRVRDEEDRRRVQVEVTDAMAERAMEVYGPLAAQAHELFEGRSQKDLRTVRDLLLRGAELQLERAAELRERINGEPAAGPPRAAGTSGG